MNTLALGRMAALALGILLTACGGGETGSASTGTGGSRAPAVVSVGVITGFGSVIVNGITFATSGANVIIDDSPNRPDSELRLGMVVKVKGTVGSDGKTGTATSVEFDSDLEGPLDAAPTLTASGGSFAVLGLSVTVDANTVFDNVAGLADLAADSLVEVSGFRDGAVLRATRVELKTGTTAIELKGSIGNVTATSFALGSVTVSYAGATLKNVATAGLSAGVLVEVKASAAPTGGVLTATSVEVEASGVGAADGDKVEIEGFLAGLSGSSFSVNGQAVTVDAQTVYEGGTAASLANGARVEAEGTVTAGVLVATRIQFKQAANVKITAQVTAKAGTATELTVFGGANPGITVTTSATTVFQDNSSAALRTFAFADIAVNDWLEIDAAKTGARALSATKVVRVSTPSGNRSILEGPLDSATLPNLVILGITGVTQVGTRFNDVNDNPITQVAFFAATAPGVTVKIRGPFTGTSIGVEEAELQD